MAIRLQIIANIYKSLLKLKIIVIKIQELATTVSKALKTKRQVQPLHLLGHSPDSDIRTVDVPGKTKGTEYVQE